MTRRQARLMIAMISSILLLWVVQRRRSMLQRLPELVEERIVLPVGDFVRDARAARQEPEGETSDRMARKVGRNRKISVGGKLYGPLDSALIGEQVEVEEHDGQLLIWAHGAEVARFEVQQ